MGLSSVHLDGVSTHLVSAAQARDVIADAWGQRQHEPLAVVSVNLDHIHHFGDSRRHARGLPPYRPDGGLSWLNLIDGVPVARQVRRLTRVPHPKLSGSDLIEPILSDAASHAQTVAFLGGAPERATALEDRIRRDWPGLRWAGHFAPSREELDDPAACLRIAERVQAAGVDVLVVCLGKPRQEDWIEDYGVATGARVLLAFGAVVDFLTGDVARAPGWIAQAGFEWAWRLGREPRRLARRYLVDGPPAYLAMRRRIRA